MENEKLQFEFEVKPTSDGKSNVLCITSITFQNGKSFKMPVELQPVSHHEIILNTDVFKKVKNAIKKRHKKEKFE